MENQGDVRVRNERQRRITEARVRELERALSRAPGRAASLHPRLAQTVEAGYREMIARLKRELADYAALRQGETESVALTDVTSLGDALIAARVARKWTQADLAAALGLPAQQVQRYEATGYSRASLKRVNEVARALGVSLEGAAVISGSRSPAVSNAPGS